MPVPPRTRRPPPRPPPPICAPVPAPPFPVPLDFEPPHAAAASAQPASKTSNARPARQPARGATNIDRSRVGDALRDIGGLVDEAGIVPYWAIRLFCSTLTRLSVQKVQPEP